MKVEMKFRIEGTRNGVRWPAAGGVVDLPEGEANDLISQGYAVAVAPEKAEKAVAPDSESGKTPAPRKAVAKKAEKRA